MAYSLQLQHSTYLHASLVNTSGKGVFIVAAAEDSAFDTAGAALSKRVGWSVSCMMLL